MLDEILEFNKQFVANKGYEKWEIIDEASGYRMVS